MSQMPNLALPYLLAAQAQKHVTHNEAIRALDCLIQLSVLDRQLTAPPTNAADGDRFIVAAGATGAWAGWDGRITAFQDGAWMSYAPRPGWLAWIVAESRLVTWTGSAWTDTVTTTGDHGGLTGLGDDDHPQYLTEARGDARYLAAAPASLGINTAPDPTNRLAAKSNAVLLTHDDVTPGTGDMRLTLNKAASPRTASVVFQSNWSGRAEFGLSGDDDFHVKVSADGAAWQDALVIDGATGAVSFPNTTLASNVAVDDEGTSVLAAAQRLDFVGAGVTVTNAGSGKATITIPGGGGGGASPGGAPGQVQVNVAGAFAGDSGLTYDSATDALSVGGALNLPDTINADTGVLRLGGYRVLHKYGALNNLFLGVLAGNFSATGGGNVSVGYQTFASLTTGQYNMAFGQYALGALTTGSNNVAIGNSALAQQATGSNNVAIGGGTCNFGAGGTGMVAIGRGAAPSGGAATGPVVIGDQAGNAATTPTYSVMVGRLAGRDVTTGANNVLIGHQAGAGITTGANNVVIGGATGLPPALANNVIIADGAGNRRITVDGSGNVGLGTTDQYGGGSRVIGIANCTTPPSSSPTGGGVLYVEGGALKFRGSSGTVTTIAPA